jgi:hypothetical protein
MPFKDPEKRREYVAEHYRKNIDAYKEKASEWGKKNPEKIKMRGATRYHNNPEKENDRVKEWIGKNGEKYRKYNKEYAAKWRYNNPERRCYTNYKHGAKRRGLEFRLTFDEFMSYWKLPCNYCGDEIQTIGLDRVDNGMGYITGNVISCCSLCNFLKLDRSVIDFISHCRRVVEYTSMADKKP